MQKLIGIAIRYRQFYTWADTLTIRTVYLTCIRPHLEYAAQLWDPCNKKDIEALESVQKFACKVCLKIWDDDMLHLLNLPPLHSRCKLVTMFNNQWILVFPTRHFHFSAAYICDPLWEKVQFGATQFDFCRPRTWTDYYQTSYFPSVIYISME